MALVALERLGIEVNLDDMPPIYGMIAQVLGVVAQAGATLAALTALGVAVGASTGGFVGLLFGACGAIFTFGLSLWVGAIVGAASGGALGGALGGLLGLRKCSFWAEECLLYHPQEYSSPLTPEHCAGTLGRVRGHQYIMQRVAYSLAPVYGQSLPQQAFLVRPEGAGVDELWIVFGGNAMLATDFMNHCQEWLSMDDGGDATSARPRVAFLLVDYPGYGLNAGKPSPSSVLEASRCAIRAALLQIEGPAPRISLLGHSLGAAAASQLAVHLAGAGTRPGRLVLSAPFTDIPEMASHIADCVVRSDPDLGSKPLMFWLAMAFSYLRPVLVAFFVLIIPHRWANVKTVPKAACMGWDVTIIHGAKDNLVPPYMGRALHDSSVEALASSQVAARVSMLEVPKAGHNDVLLKALPEYAKAMGFVRPK